MSTYFHMFQLTIPIYVNSSQVPGVTRVETAVSPSSKEIAFLPRLIQTVFVEIFIME